MRQLEPSYYVYNHCCTRHKNQNCCLYETVADDNAVDTGVVVDNDVVVVVAVVVEVEELVSRVEFR
jgi:hypothetical protein